VNSVRASQRKNGFTLVEMLVVIGIIGLLAALLLPVLSQAQARAKRIECVSDLREIGAAYHIFANDHGGKFPTQVSTNDSGALEFANAAYQINGHIYFSYKFVLPLAGIISTPKLFACPADLTRFAATNFSQFNNNSNFSYDVGLVPGNDPRQIFAADRGLPATPKAGYVDILQVPGSISSPHWRSPHGYTGNILFADGHVELSSDSLVKSEESEPEDLVYPDVVQSLTVATSGGGTGGGGSTASSAPPQSSPANQPAPINQSPAPGPSGQPPRAIPQTTPAAGGFAPANADTGSAALNGSSRRLSGTVSGSTQTPLTITSTVPEEVVTDTNAPEKIVASTDDDGSDMSPANRHAAHVFRSLFFGTYFLILLLLLAYGGYRYWRWKQNLAHKYR